MRYIGAYLLLNLAGTEPTEQKMKDVLTAANVSCDEAVLKSLMEKMKGKDIGELIELGKTKMSSMSAAPVSAGAPVAATTSAPAAEKSEKKVEEEEESDDLGFNLFD